MRSAVTGTQKRYRAGWLLIGCLVISVFLCYGQIRNSKALLAVCLLSFLGFVVLACRRNAVFAVLLYFLPWSPLLRLDNKSVSFFTIALLAVCLVYCVKDYLSFNTYQSVLAFFLMLLTLVAKLWQGNPIQNNYLFFIIMLFLLPGVVEKSNTVSFKDATLFFAAGVITAALIAQQTVGLPNISKYITVQAYSSITRRSGFYGDPNFYAAHITACLAGVQLLLSREERWGHQLALLAVMILLLYCGLLSASKSFVFITAGLFLVWVPILLEKGHRASKFRLLIGILCAGVVILSSAAFEPLFEAIDGRLSYAANVSQLTTKRTDLWMDYLSEFTHNIPLTLLGQGYTSVTLHGWASHNTIIQSVYQFGLLGVPLLFVWVILTLKRVQRKLEGGHPQWKYAVLMLVGVVMPWIALDILFFDEFFLLPVYVVLGSNYSGACETLSDCTSSSDCTIPVIQ